MRQASALIESDQENNIFTRRDAFNDTFSFCLQRYIFYFCLQCFEKSSITSPFKKIELHFCIICLWPVLLVFQKRDQSQDRGAGGGGVLINDVRKETL